MIIGVPKEIKDNENRIAITPAGVKSFAESNHSVLVEKSAGAGSGISDSEFIKAGAEIVDSTDEVFYRADMILKVKEPLEPELNLFKEGQVLFTYLHLAADPHLTKKLADTGIIGIAYETVQEEDGRLPLLVPMSEVAGRLAIQVGATYLEKIQGGRGVLLSGVPGVPPSNVVILGGGTVGINATKIAVGIGADVAVLDISHERLRYLDDLFSSRVITLMSNTYNIESVLQRADVVVGGVLVAGAKAPVLVTREMLSLMKEGSVIVDVAVDQGGCFETTRPTTHSNPTYVVDGVIHYCVANMPGKVPRTSTFALTNATLPYALRLANHGVIETVREDISIARGVNLWEGKVTHRGVAEATGLDFVPLKELI